MSEAAGDDRSRLVRALALSQRFHLYLVRVESPRAADQLLHALPGELRKLGRDDVRVVRLDPYEGRATADPLEDRELADRVLLPLLDPPEQVRRAIHVVDASRAAFADSDPWARVFSLWNEKRNLVRGDSGEVLVLLPSALDAVFARVAPDVWSIRSGEYVVGEESLQSGRSAGPLLDVRLFICAAPPFTLFGGDVVVSAWTGDIIEARISADSVSARQDGDRSPVLLRRKQRFAEATLSLARYSEAEALFSEILRGVEPGSESMALALSGLAVALTAQDRSNEAVSLTERAIALLSLSSGLRLVPGTIDRVLRAAALTQWCQGHLDAAERLDAKVRSEGPRWDRILRLVERGHLAAEMKLFALLAKSRVDITPSDFDVLAGKLDEACRAFELGEMALEPARARAMRALVEMARGNEQRAALLLPRFADAYGDQELPESGSRAAALHAYASGLLATISEDRAKAATWFEEAHRGIAEWGRYGLDRRSRLRAKAMVDLCLTQLQLDASLALPMARALAADTEALLGDTGEDCVARAIAVLAHDELARRLAATAHADALQAAGRALALAEPLRALDVPAWNAVLRAAERSSTQIASAPP